jgi:hypothetical protein
MCDIREQVDDLAKSIYGVHLRSLIRRNVPCILNFRLPRRHTPATYTHHHGFSSKEEAKEAEWKDKEADQQQSRDPL